MLSWYTVNNIIYKVPADLVIWSIKKNNHQRQCWSLFDGPTIFKTQLFYTQIQFIVQKFNRVI